MQHKIVSLLAVMSLFGLASCAGVEKEAKYPTGAERSGVNGDIYAKPESIFGDGGLRVLGDSKDNKPSGDTITVNAYLWRAALDTVSFMPLTTVDPFGGVVLTDWYSDPVATDERYKLNVFVIGSQLRSDAIRVTAFQQEKHGNTWRDKTVDPAVASKIEDAILTRARQIRIGQSD